MQDSYQLEELLQLLRDAEEVMRDMQRAYERHALRLTSRRVFVDSEYGPRMLSLGHLIKRVQSTIEEHQTPPSIHNKHLSNSWTEP